MDNLEEQCRQNARDVASAMAAHHQNTKLLNALRVTQAEHTRILADHGRKLDEHGRKLDEHTTMLGKLLVGMHGLELGIKHLIDRERNGSADDK